MKRIKSRISSGHSSMSHHHSLVQQLKNLLFLFTFCFFVVRNIEACPAVCQCSGTKVNCQYKFLARIPQNIPPDTAELLLDSNVITEVTKQDFAGLNNLHSLTLTSNKIFYIEPGTFDGLDLTSLHMSDNNVTVIDKHLFHNLTNLVHLRLNQVSKFRPLCIEDGAFRSLNNLQQLYLGQNQMTYITNKTFEGLENLQILDLQRNNFKTFDKSAFRFFSSITRVTMETTFTSTSNSREFPPCCCQAKEAVLSTSASVDFLCRNYGDGVGNIKRQLCIYEDACLRNNSDVCYNVRYRNDISASLSPSSSTITTHSTHTTTTPTLTTDSGPTTTTTATTTTKTKTSSTIKHTKTTPSSSSATPSKTELEPSTTTPESTIHNIKPLPLPTLQISSSTSTSILGLSTPIGSSSVATTCQSCSVNPSSEESKAVDEPLKTWVVVLIVLGAIVVLVLFVVLIMKNHKGKGGKFSPKTHSETAVTMKGVNNAGYNDE